ncbi:MAG TPA: hypothetical protein VFZ66_00625 [Herpetosiphonaceae bacterium]
MEFPEVKSEIRISDGSRPGTAVATITGRDVSILGWSAEYGYAAAIWSADRTQIGVARWVCSLDKAELPKRSEAENGVYLVDLARDRSYRLIDQVPGQFNLLAVGGQGLTLRSPVRGVATIGTNAAPVSVESLEGSRRVEATIGTTPPSPNGYGYRNNWAGYIHQHYDTKDGFNGWWACGPTSSVMSIAYYILPTNYVWSSSPYGHGSNYGGVVC